MADTTLTNETYAEAAVVAASTGRGEPGWLTEKRAESARAFEALPMPTPKLRPWKYTDLGNLTIDGYEADTSFVAQIAGAAPAGGFAGTLANAANDATFGPIVEEHLGSLVPHTEGKFVADNSAQWQDGVFGYAPRSQTFAEPVTVTLNARGGAIFPRLAIHDKAGGDEHRQLFVAYAVVGQLGFVPRPLEGIVEPACLDPRFARGRYGRNIQCGGEEKGLALDDLIGSGRGQ